ncbi:PH domain-containing protein [Hymenobacter arizonensis]|uniref:PH domain-containing protein n=1 Tax=Hymenobacter arizonensis TaxID=1227077 RepID=UPI0015A5A727|nr:PH domain-containing protein [Hymenobacter arizonensis]
MTEGQDPKTVEKLMGNVTVLLAAGEEIEYVAVQQKPLFNAFPDCVAVTPMRIIFCRLRNFGLSMEFKTYLWEDVQAMQFVGNVSSANITVKTARVTEIMGYLPQSQARKLHDFAKEREAEYAGQHLLRNREQATGLTSREIKISYEPSPVEPNGPLPDKPLKTDQQRKSSGKTSLHQTGYDRRGNAALPVY